MFMDATKCISKKQLDMIYRKTIIKNFLKTIKYIYKIQSQDRKDKILVINGCNDVGLWKKIIWHILKYLCVSLEISALRKKVFYMVHCSYAVDLNEREFMKIVNNKSNWWLDSSFLKVQLFESYCEKLLNDTSICQAMCELTDCAPEDYHNKNKTALEALTRVKANCFVAFEKERAEEIKKEKFFANISADLYTQSFDDLDFLEK